MADISKINGYEIKDKTARDNHEALVEELNETIDGINETLAGLEYTLPVATSTALGGIKIGYTASGANLPVALSSEKAYVAVTKTAVTTALGYTPPESNTDTKVTQTKTTSASSMPLLLAPAGQTATTTTTANFTNNIYAVPSTGRLYLTGGSNPLFGLQATNGTAFFLQAQTDKLFLGPTSAKALTFTGSTGAISMPNNLTVTGTISEGGTTLANKYLGVSAVSVTQKLTSGTEIGSVTVNGTATKLYAPPSGLGSQEVEDIVDTRLEDYVQTQALVEGRIKLKAYGFATETYVDNSVASLVGGAPETLNALNELAAALGNDPNFATTMATELGKKQTTIKGAATTITSSNLTASRALVSDANGKVAVSAVTSTELGYLDGVTSAIQTQLNGKLSTTGKAASATVADSANAVAWGNVSGKPTFATVATSGSYNDLTNKPTIPSAYTLPVATSSVRGGIKIGYSASGANIPLQLSSEKAYVALTKSAVTSALGYTPPTTDTTYSVATASKAGLVKPVSVITKPTLNSVTTTSGKYYQVQMSSDGNMFVNVPWQAGSSVDLSSYATLASPTFTGTPKAPTAAKGTNTTQIATTAFVNSQGFVTSEVIDDLVDKQELEGGTVNLSAYNFAGQKDNPNLTYYATDNGTTTAGTWLGKNDNVTALFDGLSVNYKVTKAGGSSTTTFNLNGLGAKTVYLRGDTKLTTNYAVGTIINLIYNASNSRWYCADYDANSYAYLRQYYTLTTTDGEYPIIYSYTKDTGTSSYKTAYGAVKGGFTFNPSTDTLSVGNINFTGGGFFLGPVTVYKDETSVDFMLNGGDAGIYLANDENGDPTVELYGNVTVNGEPIGSGGGSTLYRHNIEITATFNGKSHIGGIVVYDTRSTKHTTSTLYDMYNEQVLNFSGFLGDPGGAYAFVGVISITGNGSGVAHGLWSQGNNTSVLQFSSMTFTINDANYILTSV